MGTRRARLLALGGLLIVAAALSCAAVALVPAGGNLRAAERELSKPPGKLTPSNLAAAGAHLREANSALNAAPGRVAGLIPLVGANVSALRQTVDAASSVLDTAESLLAASSSLREKSLVRKGRVRVALLSDLEEPMAQTEAALTRLARTARRGRSGWLLPPLWDALADIEWRAERGAAALGRGVDVLRVTPRLLGYEGPRNYLVLLVNNAELRGSGGLLSGVGTLGFERGRAELGEFLSIHDLRTSPAATVPSPPEFEKRFATYGANSTLWVNTTWSPEFPDVALVAARLFERVTGLGVDGSLKIDPAGLTALLPPGSRFRVEGASSIGRGGLEEFALSDAYRGFDTQRARRDALLAVGANAFERIVEGGLGAETMLRSAGRAVAGGHIAFSTFDPEEEKALEGAGIAGAVAPGDFTDNLFVTAQNFGGGGRRGSKLDYWSRRQVGHECVIDESGSASCSTTVSLRNVAPRGLGRYVAGRPYGLLRNLVEVHVPSKADLNAVTMGGRPVEFRPEAQSGLTSVGVFVDLPRGRRTSVRVSYDLPRSDSYSLVARPQPLADDARLHLSLTVPDTWTVRSTGFEKRGHRWELDGDFDETYEVNATPRGKTGLPALWDRISPSSG